MARTTASSTSLCPTASTPTSTRCTASPSSTPLPSTPRHLSQAYNSNVGTFNRQGFVEVLAAQQSPINKDWFQGTADAVRQYLWLFNESNCGRYIIMSGDHLYRMDYKDFIRKHREVGADITVSAVPMDEERAAAFGLMKIDETGRIIDLQRNPLAMLSRRWLWTLLSSASTPSVPRKCPSSRPWVSTSSVPRRWSPFSMSTSPILTTAPRSLSAKDMGDAASRRTCTMVTGRISVPSRHSTRPTSTATSLRPPSSPSTRPPPAPPSTPNPASFPPPAAPRPIARAPPSVNGCFIHKSVISNSMIGLRSNIQEGCVIEDTMIMAPTTMRRPMSASLSPGAPPRHWRGNHYQRCYC